MVLLEVAEGVSRVHASRRLFNFLKVPPPRTRRGGGGAGVGRGRRCGGGA